MRDDGAPLILPWIEDVHVYHLYKALKSCRSIVMERVLVCLLASTRAHQLTFPSFKRQVLDELNGDLALALAIDEKYDYANPFWQHAKYRWTAPDFRDVGEAFDLAQRWLCHQYNVPAPDWRPMLQIKGIWQGGIRSPDPAAEPILRSKLSAAGSC